MPDNKNPKHSQIKGLNYSGNFHTNTKGWADEKGAKQVQISCKIQGKFKNKF
jgi:hypothetical protein